MGRRYASRRGFVLVEVLVVSVIVAILAAVAVPLYTGYVRAQRVETVQQLAQAAAIAANAYYRRNNVDPTTVDQLGLFFPDPTKYQVLLSGDNVTVRDASDNTIAYSLNFR